MRRRLRLDRGWRGQSRLRHRIFWVLGTSVLLSTFVAGVAVHALGTNQSESIGLRAFAAERFAVVWERESERMELVESVERNFPVKVSLMDARRTNLVERDGKGQCRGRLENVPVVRDGIYLGVAQFCMTSSGISHVLLLSMATFVAVLWIASGLVARRLVRPLDELVAVAKEIGNGNLSARMRLWPSGPGRPCLGNLRRETAGDGEATGADAIGLAGISNGFPVREAWCREFQERHRYRRRGHDEVSEVAAAINQMAEKIEGQIEGQKALLAAVSHEVRSPLARLRMLVELQRESCIESSRLDAMDVELAEMDSLTLQLLAQSRLEFQPIDRQEVLATVLATTVLSRSNLSASLLRDMSKGSSLRVDAGLFSRALLNVLENAKKHAYGVREFRVVASGDSMRFEVVDDGPGFSKQAMEQMFEPFAVTGNSQGLGLGLSLVKRIAEAHGGKVSVTSEEGSGATVVLEIPARG